MLRRMESNEVLRQALRKTSPKAVAAELGVSLSLVYKWTEANIPAGAASLPSVLVRPPAMNEGGRRRGR